MRRTLSMSRRSRLVVRRARRRAASGAGAAGAASKPRVVTIGVIAPLDGGLTSFGQGIRDSVELAVEQANDARGDPGLDDQGARARRLVRPDEGRARREEAGGRPDRRRRGRAVQLRRGRGGAARCSPGSDIALVSPSNTLTSLTLGADPTQAEAAVRQLLPPGRSRLAAGRVPRRAGTRRRLPIAAMVSETKAVSKGLADRFDAEFAKAGGTTSVRKTVPDDATAEQFAEFITAASQAKPDLVFFGGEYNVAATLRSASFAAGLTAPQMGGDGMNDPAYITAAGQPADGSYTSGVGVPIETLPGADQFLAAYRAAGFTTDPTDYGPYAYDAANTVISTPRAAAEGQEGDPVGRAAKVISGVQRPTPPA